MNVDIAYEILRHLDPIDRCRYRLIDRSFNEACILWWRGKPLDEVDVEKFVGGRRDRRRIVSFLRFVSKYVTIGMIRAISILADDQLFEEIVAGRRETANLFDTIEHLDLRCLRMENLAKLSACLKLFPRLSELNLAADRYPMIVDQWDGDETELCAAIVQLNRLDRLSLCKMELKGELLTSLNGDLSELVIDRCPDVEEANLVTMAAWCSNLDRLRLVDVYLSLDTFRRLCAIPNLRVISIAVSYRVEIDIDDWTDTVVTAGGDHIEYASITGRFGDMVDFGQLLESCPWPILIGGSDYRYGDHVEGGPKEDTYSLSMRNPKFCNDDDDD